MDAGDAGDQFRRHLITFDGQGVIGIVRIDFGDAIEVSLRVRPTGGRRKQVLDDRPHELPERLQPADVRRAEEKARRQLGRNLEWIMGVEFEAGGRQISCESVGLIGQTAVAEGADQPASRRQRAGVAQ